MAQERADSIIDLSAIDKEISQYVGYIDKAKAALVSLFETTKSFKDSNIVNLTENTRSLSVAMDGSLQTSKAVQEQNEKLVKSIQDLTAAMSKQNTTKKETNEQFAKSRYYNDQEITDNVKARETLKSRTDQIRAQGDAYKELVLRQKSAEASSKALAAEFGVHSSEARKAQAESRKLSEEVLKIDKASGNARTGVGKYAEGIKEFAVNALSALGAASLLEKGFEFIKSSVEEFIKAEQSAAKLSGILSNLGRNDALKELDAAAGELSEKLGTVSKRDVTETFQKLITYGKLTKNQILELTPVIADFAAKQGIDLPEATGIFTKAMEGNTRGLRDYGINIKNGKDTTERFGIIMSELKPRVEGAAQAIGDTLGGTIKKTSVAIEELKVQIGEKLGPAISSVEKAILEGVKGLPEFFQSFIDGFKELYDNARETYLNIKAFFGAPTDLVLYQSQKKAEADLKQGINDRREAQEFAGKQAREASENRIKETEDQTKALTAQYEKEHGMAAGKLTDQKVIAKIQKEAEEEADKRQARELESATALRNLNLKTYADLKAAGKDRTDEGKRAALAAYQTIVSVDALSKQLASSRDKRVLGFGDGHDNAPPDKKKKDLEDYALGFAKLLQDVQAFNQSSLNIDTSPLQKDLNESYIKFQKYYDDIHDLREKDLTEINKNLKDGEITFQQAQDQRKVVFEKSDKDFLKLQEAFEVNVAAIRDKYRKLDEEKKKAQVQKDFAEGLANAKRIQEELGKHAQQYFSDNVADAKAAGSGKGGPTLNQDLAIANAENQQALFNLNKQHQDGLLSDRGYKAELIIQQNVYENTQDTIKQKHAEAAVAKVAMYVNEGTKLLGDFAKLREQTELNALQKVEDQQQKNFANQVARVNASTLSEEQKAARLKQLDSERQVNQDQIDQKRRQAQNEEAKFEKAKSISSIILNTAAGVAKSIGNPFLVAFAIATGAIELAIASATPVPAYARGTDPMGHRGGLAWVGDAYKKELIKEPGKPAFWSPAKPTLMNLAKFTHVFSTDKVEEMRRGSMKINPLGYLMGEKNSQIEQKLDGIEAAIYWQTDQLTRAAANQRRERRENIIDWNSSYIKKYVKGK